MIHQYSLADYQLTIGLSEEIARSLGLTDAYGNVLTNFSIGGPGEDKEGSFVGQITVSRAQDLFTTTGDATGSWVHDKNLNRTGTITIDITQISEDIITLVQLCQIFESVQTNMPGLELTINSVVSSTSTTMVSGKDCYIQKLPDITYAEQAGRLTWSFTCGQIIYEHSRA